MDQLPVELLEPILYEAIRPGTAEGASILLVCSLWHAVGRGRLYERVTLSSQAGYDSYYLLGGSKASWRPLASAQRTLDYSHLQHLHLGFGPLHKLPFSLSSHIPGSSPPAPRFPNLALIHLDLAKGDSYLDCRPKPLSRRVSKLMGDFSAETLVLERDGSAEISLKSVLVEHLRKTRYLSLASHQVGHLPEITKRRCPEMRRIRITPYPAVRLVDLRMLCVSLRGFDPPVRVEVRWVTAADENWWDREMREGMEGEIQAARDAGENWVQGVVMLREGEDELDGDPLLSVRRVRREL